MTQSYFFPLFWIVASVAFWMCDTTQRAYVDLINAGFWDVNSRKWIKTFSVGAAIAFVACLFGHYNPVGFEAFGLMCACGMMAAVTRVLTLAYVVHGIDSHRAQMMVQAYENIHRLEETVKKDFGSEKALQSYLDYTYGRGTVSAHEVIKQRKARETPTGAAQLIH